MLNRLPDAADDGFLVELENSFPQTGDDEGSSRKHPGPSQLAVRDNGHMIGVQAGNIEINAER
jgi:hypothetical protein